MIPTEDNYVDWVLRGIHDYYARLGYSIFSYSIGQRREADLPFDRILRVGNKIVGFQFKRPRAENPPWRYVFTPHQHQLLFRYRWILYCLPRFTDWRLQNVALYHAAFAPSHGVITTTGSISGFSYRWGSLADELRLCTQGTIVDEPFDIEEFIRPLQERTADAILSINSDQGTLHAVSHTEGIPG